MYHRDGKSIIHRDDADVLLRSGEYIVRALNPLVLARPIHHAEELRHAAGHCVPGVTTGQSAANHDGFRCEGCPTDPTPWGAYNGGRRTRVRKPRNAHNPEYVEYQRDKAERAAKHGGEAELAVRAARRGRTQWTDETR